jgi:hypothetical protein
MAGRSDGKAARAPRIALAWTAALATLFVAGCERDAEHDARAQKSRAQLPYQLAVAVTEVEPAPRLARAGVIEVKPSQTLRTPLAASRTPPSMPAPTLTPSFAFVLDIPPPATPAPVKTPLPIAPPDEQQPALVAMSPTPEPAPAIAKGASGLAEVTHPLEDSEVYIPQISQSARAAYIAQVDGAAPGQRLAVRAGDTVLGTVQFQVTDGVVSVNIGQVLDLFEGRFDSARFAELRESQAAQSFVSLDELQGAGIALEYNAAYDELKLAAQRG